MPKVDAPKYQMPHEAAAFAAEWWTAADAARAWGVCPKTARRYMQRSGEDTAVVLLNVRTDRTRVVRCVRAGTPRPAAVSRGNPRFSDPAWQRANVAKRWDGHLTRAELLELRAEFEAAAIEDARDQAADYLRGLDASY